MISFLMFVFIFISKQVEEEKDGAKKEEETKNGDLEGKKETDRLIQEVKEEEENQL